MENKPFKTSKMKKSATTRSRVDMPALEPPPPPVQTQEFSSIENFDRQSQRVYFNEPATLEAIKRLGLKQSDFNYKPMRAFKKPGIDNSLVQLLYDKYEQNREKIINDTSEMRIKVIQERDKPRPIPAFVRKEQLQIQNQKERIQKIEKEGQSVMRRMALRSLREAYLQNERAIQTANTKSRMIKACQIKEEQVKNAKLMVASAPITPRRVSQVKDGVDPEKIYQDFKQHLKRAEEIKLKNEERIREAAKEKQRQQEEGKERSKRLTEEEIKRRAHFVDSINHKFNEWMESREAVILEQERKRKEHENKLKNAMDLANQTEDKRRNNVMERLKENDKKSSQAKENYEMSVREKIRRKRELIDQRAQQAQEAKEAFHREMEEAKRKAMEEEENTVRQRLQEKEANTKMSLYDQKLERETRALNARRRIAAEEYAKKLKIMANVEDTSNVSQVYHESAVVAGKKEYTLSKFQSQKAQLHEELKHLKGPEDKEGLKRIQEILKLSDGEFRELIEIATDQEFTAPPTSLAKKPVVAEKK